jgi:hypothetical protein
MKKLIVTLVVALFAVAPLTWAGEGCCKDASTAAEKPGCCPAQVSCPKKAEATASCCKDASATADKSGCCPAQVSCPKEVEAAVNQECPVKQKRTVAAKKAKSTARGGQLVSTK